MFSTQTYVVRIYRQRGSRENTLAGVVEIVQEQRSVAFVGLAALGQILLSSPRRARKGPGGVRVARTAKRTG
jgi:hypothetical protein